MCIILDINVLCNIFESNNHSHLEFKSVYDWVYHGKGKIVYGGSKYIKELSKTKYLPIFVQYRIANKAVHICNNKVDTETERASRLVQHKNFNDPHLVGLIIASGCKLICSADKKSFPFLTNQIFYSSKKLLPKIYSNKKNKNLLCDRNIAEICKPCFKTTEKQRQVITT
jgi:hypothetical protein